MAAELRRFTARLKRLTDGAQVKQLLKLRSFELHTDGAWHGHMVLVTDRPLSSQGVALCWKAGHCQAKRVLAEDMLKTLFYVAKYALKQHSVPYHKFGSRMIALTYGRSIFTRRIRRIPLHKLVRTEVITPWSNRLLRCWPYQQPVHVWDCWLAQSRYLQSGGLSPPLNTLASVMTRTAEQSLTPFRKSNPLMRRSQKSLFPYWINTNRGAMFYTRESKPFPQS